MKKKIFLSTTAIDSGIFYKKKFYLGKFCISDKLSINEFNNINCLGSVWGTRSKNIEEYFFLKKISISLLKYLTKKLNRIHKKKENKKYWKIILYPWICYYIITTFDRWKIISKFKSLKPKKKYFTHEYDLPEKFLNFKDIYDWHNKICSDTLNNYLFNKIIKFRKLKNVEIIKKKKIRIFLKVDQKYKYNLFNFQIILDKILSKIAIHFNKVYFDKFFFPRKNFLKLCLKHAQIPAKNISTFEIFKTKNFLNSDLRNNICDSINPKSDFEKFLFSNLKYFFPMSYLENFDEISLKNKNKIKKNIFIGMYSIHWNDYFKIYLAECLKVGSKYMHSNHGAGVHSNYDALYDHFDDISDKIIVQGQSRRKKEIFLGPTLFKFTNKLKNSNKLLISYHEPERYCLRLPIGTVDLNGHLDLFNSLIKFLPKLKKKILTNVKFRSKHNVGFNSEKRFSDVFGTKKIEKVADMTYKKSILNARLVLCNVPQTSYTESIFYNIPTILIENDLDKKGSNSSHFDTSIKKKILKNLLQNNMAFDNYKSAINFINNNWDTINNWWNKKEVQNTRKNYLNEFYSQNNFFKEKWSAFIKKNLNV